MKLPINPPNAIPALAEWLRTFAASVSTGWNVEHTPEGRHAFPWVRVPVHVMSFQWTVTTLTRMKYQLVGATMTVVFDLTGTTTAVAAIGFTIPGGYRSRESVSAGQYDYSDAGTPGVGTAIVVDNRVDLYKDIAGTVWTAGTTRVQGTVSFEVA